jgi:hypothetical protein
MLSLSCESGPHTPEQALTPVLLPDLSRLAAPAQQRIRDQFASSTRVTGNPNASSTDRAAAFGDLGRQ